MAGSNGLPAAKSQTSRKDMEDEQEQIDEQFEKDTWFCLQCRRRPYYERARINAILKDAERDVQLDWVDIEAGASRIPLKMDLSKVSGTSRELFPWIPFEHVTTGGAPNADGASVPATCILFNPRPTDNQTLARSPSQSRKNVSQQFRNACDTGNIETGLLSITKDRKHTRDKTDAHVRPTPVMAPHLESESASPVLRPNNIPIDLQ